MKYATTITLDEARKNIARIIDHTLLKAEATPADLERLCAEAVEYNFACVCVNPANVAFCREQLEGTDVPVASVVGFPLGANNISTKATETEFAIEDGATEIDMVLHIGMLKSGNRDYIQEEIEAVVTAAQGYLVKVIIETALLSDEEKRLACRLAAAAGAHFVKTSTGFSRGGATEKDVRLMRSVVGNKLGVKASGGIRTLENALRMVRAGANRIGTSSGIAIARKNVIE